MGNRGEHRDMSLSTRARFRWCHISFGLCACICSTFAHTAHHQWAMGMGTLRGLCGGQIGKIVTKSNTLHAHRRAFPVDFVIWYQRVINIWPNYECKQTLARSDQIRRIGQMTNRIGLVGKYCMYVRMHTTYTSSAPCFVCWTDKTRTDRFYTHL